MGAERDKMVAGELYNAFDPELSAARLRAKKLCRRLNDLEIGAAEQRAALFKELFGKSFKNLVIEPAFFCDYGTNITFGENVYFNHNCVILDGAPVTVGDNTLFGPAVQIYTATHPLSAGVRRKGLEAAHPITIGSDVWVGGGAILCPGVTIGSRSVIGAGSVVVKDIPEDSLAVGNPCRVIRKLSPA